MLDFYLDCICYKVKTILSQTYNDNTLTKYFQDN